MRAGYKKLKDASREPAWIISQRTRLRASYSKSFYSLGISIQDVRLWGDESLVSSTGVFGDDASLDLNEAWIEMKFLKYSSVKIGRQYFMYDDYRLLWGRNWNQHSLSYDALLYSFKHPFLEAEFAISWNNTQDLLFENFFPEDRIKTLNFIHLSKKWGESFRSNIMILFAGYEKSDTTQVIYVRNTYGTYLSYNKNNLNLSGSAYYQGGKNREGLDVDAWCLSANAGVKAGKMRFKAGWVLISGNKPGTEVSGKKDQLFDIIYGARHRYYGYMDYFSNIPKSTGGGGLADYFAAVEFHPLEKIRLEAAYHYFELAREVMIEGAKKNKSLASEIDLSMRWLLSEEIELQGGYSLMLPQETLENMQGFNKGASDYSSWAWLMLTAKIK
ncbi:MAG: alginate export family protein [Bacteroidota bacterium]|nr:alginate export family protein [Bacteroidota bacterium]